MNKMQKEQFNELIGLGFGWKSSNPNELKGNIQGAQIKWNLEKQSGACLFDGELIILNWNDLQSLVEYLNF